MTMRANRALINITNQILYRDAKLNPKNRRETLFLFRLILNKETKQIRIFQMFLIKLKRVKKSKNKFNRLIPIKILIINYLQDKQLQLTID